MTDNGYAYFIIIQDFPYIYMAYSGNVTISSFEEEGGAIEGTFQATFILIGDFAMPAAIGGTPQSVTGSFRK